MNNRLEARYLGLALSSPLVPSASPLTATLSGARTLEDAGAAAIVMHSLFEEECQQDQQMLHQFLYDREQGHAESDGYLPEPDGFKTAEERYLETVRQMKEHLEIPVIASLNGVTRRGWSEHARQIAEAGADALELNIYYVAADGDEAAQDVERRYLDILHAVRSSVPDLPLAVKISSQFTSPVHFVKQLKQIGADAVVLFNRFLQPDIHLESRRLRSLLELSRSEELRERLRWIAIVRAQVAVDIAVTGGVHTAEDVIKAQMCGADITQMASALMQRGPGILPEIKTMLLHWLDEHEYDSLLQLKGSVSYRNAADPSGFERANYLETLDSWRP
ncbi:putative dihydropyrimidine dehydrogenase [NADP+], similar to dihydroorotate dehydrogenase [Marinobacterium lacunae]|uniref:Putative dihydropyrimidine dehydrogenase [NADP+], similar to dihydroorotate dehydrogenase n=1 Tax=Marinobacterium lacunae TaxID=1232683 RepID=A0A081G1L0_9GAMM|nr:dihydroorotate dehydrogenase-like protein [Marinobacterium lacunae]KEA64665.1 putative dihydropyrimidine dehydrogenase [NADP+], similar to dihydroorotate dehydrogenase [Marinobacterium lacunae]MBR9882500.1 dihydroorotate dehydrogenase-like protein [Oceanospirillales bacterium]